MIRSTKELKASTEKLNAVEHAAAQSVGLDTEVLRALANDVRREILEYKEIRNGQCRVFQLASFEDLADALIKARLAKGWTHGQLAPEVGVREQMVQKDEAGAYGRASLGRLADIAEALGYELQGVLRPPLVVSVVNGPSERVTTPGVQRLVVLQTPSTTQSPLSPAR